MTVVAAVKADLLRLGSGAEGSGLAETALALARELDKPKNSATSKSMCAKALIDVLRELQRAAPQILEADGVTDINSERNKRRAGGSASAGP